MSAKKTPAVVLPAGPEPLTITVQTIVEMRSLPSTYLVRDQDTGTVRVMNLLHRRGQAPALHHGAKQLLSRYDVECALAEYGRPSAAAAALTEQLRYELAS